MKDKIKINCQSSIRIEDKKIIYFDPYKIMEESHDADIIFLTHDHFDHFDITSIKYLLKEDTKIVIPLSMLDKVLSSGLKNEQLITVIPNETYNILGYQIETIPSYNIVKNFHPRANNYVGYVITINDERIYISGDIDNIPEALDIHPDIALIPIGGTYTMNYQEASDLINKMQPKVVIPTHYKTIVGTYEDALKFQKLLNNNIECLLLIK